jgi:hypothetical protein
VSSVAGKVCVLDAAASFASNSSAGRYRRALARLVARFLGFSLRLRVPLRKRPSIHADWRAVVRAPS